MKIRRLPVLRDDFEAEPFPDSLVRLQYERRFSHAEYAKLKMGILALESTFAFFEDEHLYIYRRHKDQIKGLFDITISPTVDGAEIVDLQVEKIKADVIIRSLSLYLGTIIYDKSDTRLTWSSWGNLKPMPDSYSEHQTDELFTERQFCHLMWGQLPLSMDDKWFVYGENMTLYYHRSWTGICVFQVTFEKVDDNYRATSVIINEEMSDFGLHHVLRSMRLYADYYPYRYEIIDF